MASADALWVCDMCQPADVVWDAVAHVSLRWALEECVFHTFTQCILWKFDHGNHNKQKYTVHGILMGGRFFEIASLIRLISEAGNFYHHLHIQF